MTTLDDLAQAAFRAVDDSRWHWTGYRQDWSAQDKLTKDAFRLVVKTVLDRARHPTAEMVQAGADEINPYASDSVTYEQTCEAVLDAWQAMMRKFCEPPQ